MPKSAVGRSKAVGQGDCLKPWQVLNSTELFVAALWIKFSVGLGTPARRGAGKGSLVLPASFIEDGEQPLTCAQGELLEETGYACNDWELLGSFVANGNYGCGS